MDPENNHARPVPLPAPLFAATHRSVLDGVGAHPSTVCHADLAIPDKRMPVKRLAQQ